MTGFLDRLRSRLGALVGGNDDDAVTGVDAEAPGDVEGGAAASTPPAGGSDGDDATTERGAGAGADEVRDGEVEDATDPAGSFACSVCGTAVDDPTAACPLCRSTDVGPASEVAAGDDGATRVGRTTVTSAEDEDEAVARLRDVADGDEREG